MAKQRDFIDYANFGSSLFQNLQLNGVENKLSTMASVAAMDQLKAEQEDRWRENVFQADSILRGLQRRIDDNKAGVLAISIFSLGQFKKHNLTSANFRAYEDKEKLRAVIDGFKELVNQCESSLSAQEQAEARLCARYMEDPIIKADATVPVEFADALEKANRELSELTAIVDRGSQVSRGGPEQTNAPLAFGGVGLILGFLVLLVGSVTHQITGIGLVGLLICFVSLVVMMIACAEKLRCKFSAQARKEVADAAEAKRKNLAEVAEAKRLIPEKEAEIKAIEQKIKIAIADRQSEAEWERDHLMKRILSTAGDSINATSP